MSDDRDGGPGAGEVREATAIDLFTPGEDRLLLDAMLGKLATYLRMCGYDAEYVESEATPAEIGPEAAAADPDGGSPTGSESGSQTGPEAEHQTGPESGSPSGPDSETPADTDRDAAIRAWAARESRTLLTRDRALGTATPGAILLTGRQIEAQLAELARAGFAVRLPERPERCATCNAALEAVGEQEPTPEYAPATARMDVWRCPACGQHYWQGSHWADVAKTLEDVR